MVTFQHLGAHEEAIGLIESALNVNLTAPITQSEIENWFYSNQR